MQVWLWRVTWRIRCLRTLVNRRIAVKGRQGTQINQNIPRGSRKENWMALEIISINIS